MMNEHLIEKRNFENQKNKLKIFSKDIPSSVNLPTSITEAGLFGWFDHKVTGDQFNDLTNKIQTYLKATNSYVIKIIREFDEVYKTFETLDKEYLNKIIANVKAVEVATNQAIAASNQANIASNKANDNTNDIKKIIEVQKITIDKLVQFKDKFESDHQNGDIWNHIKNLKEQTGSIQENFILNKEKTEKQVKTFHQNLENQKVDILAKLHISSSKTFDKINLLSQGQEEKYHNVKNKIKLIEESSNKKLTILELRIIEQKKEVLEILNKLSSNFTRLNNLELEQKEQHQNINKEIHLVKDSFNEKLTIQKLGITKQKEEILEILDKLSTNLFARINDLEQEQKEQHQNVNKEIHLIKESFSEKLTIQELGITKQKEEIFETLDKLSTNLVTRINDLEQEQKYQYQNLNKEVALVNISISKVSNDINLQRKQFSTKIKYIAITLFVLGGISLTHLVLNILKII